MKTFIICLIVTSLNLLLFPALGWLSVASWLIDAVMLTLIARYVMTRERDDTDSWSGL